jgi:hypothetical protein
MVLAEPMKSKKVPFTVHTIKIIQTIQSKLNAILRIFTLFVKNIERLYQYYIFVSKRIVLKTVSYSAGSRRLSPSQL